MCTLPPTEGKNVFFVPLSLNFILKQKPLNIFASSRLILNYYFKKSVYINLIYIIYLHNVFYKNIWLHLYKKTLALKDQRENGFFS